MNEMNSLAAAGSAKVEVYTRKYCGYCVRAKMLLDEKGIDYIEYPIDADSEKRNEMIQRAAGGSTVPQIFINNQSIGGCTELYMLERSGELDALLSKSAN